MPADLIQMAKTKGGQPRNFRSTIRDHLYDLGWTWDRVRESFQEIRQVVRG